MSRKRKVSKRLYAMRYAKRGWKVIPIVPDAKNPMTAKGFYDGTDDTEKIKTWWKTEPNANVAVVTGKASGLFVVDEDKHGEKDGSLATTVLQKILGEFDTYTVSTPSGGKHYYFKLPPEGMGCRPSVFVGVDIKGNGGYVLAAGSNIEKKQYKVIKDVEVAEAPSLLLTFLKYGDKSLPPINLSEGDRNTELFRYCCQMRAIGVEEDTTQEIARLANNTFDRPLDEYEVEKTVTSAYRPDYDNAIKPLPKGELSERIEKLNQEFAVVIIGGKFAIARFRIDYKTGNQVFDFMGVQDFQNLVRNRHIVIGEKRKKLSCQWLDSNLRRTYDSITFDPNQENVPDHVFNMWSGYGVEPVIGNCQPFLDFIRDIICDEDQELYNYVIAWLANIIQDPTNRSHTAIVLHGDQGVGKTFFADAIGKLFGRHYILLSDLHHLVGNFTAQLKDKCLVFVDEMTWEGQSKKSQGILKDRISGKTFIMEAKGKDAIELPNYMSFVLASNSRNIVPAAMDERRYAMLHVSDKKKQDTEYFGSLVNHMQNGGYEALLHYFLNYELDGIDLRHIPRTGFLLETKLQNLSDTQAFWYEVLKRKYILRESKGWPEWIPFQDVVRGYCSFVHRDRDRGLETELGFELKKLLPPNAAQKKRRVKGKIVNGYRVPSLKRCRKHFAGIIGEDNLWDD